MSRRKRSTLRLEFLEPRHLLSGVVFHNSDSPFDVNGDVVVSPADVLTIIRQLNAPTPSETEVPPINFTDVNNDGVVSPLDALSTIRYLNQMPGVNNDGNGADDDLRLTSSLSSSAGVGSGLVTYERERDEGSLQESLKVSISNAPPETTLQIAVDGQSVSTLDTNQDGSAELILSTQPGEGEAPLPDDFPAIGAQMMVSVGPDLFGVLDDVNGTTTVDVVGGDLVIRGDDDNNYVFVTQVDYQEFLVVGVNTAIDNLDGGEVFEDAVNGTDLYYTFAHGVHDDVRAYMRGGDDVFLIGGYIDLESLNDQAFTLANNTPQMDIPGRLDIFTSGGDDLVYVGGATIGERILINAGQGEENVVAVGGGAAAVGAMDLDVVGDLFDLIGFVRDELAGELEEGEILESVKSVLGHVHVHRDVIIDTFNGEDAVYIADAHIGDDLIVNTRRGDDRVFVGTGGVLDIDTFGLEDDLADFIEAMDFKANVDMHGYLHIHTHGGDDLVRLGGSILLHEVDQQPDVGQLLYVPGGLVVDKSAHIHTHSGNDEILIGVTVFELEIVEPVMDGEGESNGDEVLPPILYEVRIGYSLHVHSGSDDDLVQIGGSYNYFGPPDPSLMQDTFRRVLDVGRSMYIITSCGDDAVLMYGKDRTDWLRQPMNGNGQYVPYGYDINVGRRGHIDTGSGDDYVVVTGPEIQGEGASMIGVLRTGDDLFIATGCGDDSVMLDGEIDFIDQVDIGFRGISVEDDLFVITGSGNDFVHVRSVDVADLAHLNTGCHYDLMIVDHLYAKYLDIFLGGHDDCFRIDDSVGEKRSRAFGGWGYDKYSVHDTVIALYSFEEEGGCFAED